MYLLLIVLYLASAFGVGLVNLGRYRVGIGFLAFIAGFILFVPWVCATAIAALPDGVQGQTECTTLIGLGTSSELEALSFQDLSVSGGLLAAIGAGALVLFGPKLRQILYQRKRAESQKAKPEGV